jgi:hypothetical protein
MASQENRQHARQPCSSKVTLGGQSNGPLDVVDISETGLRLRSPVTLGVGKTVELTFPAQQQQVKGTVRSERPAENQGLYIGIEFAESQPKLLAAVQAGG